MPSLAHTSINGDPAALDFDRAVGEIRRGRAIRIADGSRSLLVAAVETMQPPLFRRLESAGAGRALLLVTAERALAAGLSRQLSGPIAIAFPPGVELEDRKSVV